MRGKAGMVTTRLLAWDISTAVFVQSFSVTDKQTAPRGVFFKPDGLKMYVTGSGANNVDEYNLSTAWDLSSASYAQSSNLDGREGSASDLFFKPDGSTMYVIGFENDSVLQFSLSTPWDISSRLYVKSFSVAAQESAPLGLFFKPDGLRMYVVGQNERKVCEYHLATAWDVGSMAFKENLPVHSQDTSPTGVLFKPDGSKLYIVGSTNDSVYEYDLSSPWDLSTASYLQNFSVTSQEDIPTGLFFRPDGLKMFVVGGSDDDINEYDIGRA